jgi:hypothetical protein
MKKLIILFAVMMLSIQFMSCNGDKKQNLRGLFGEQFYLDVKETEKVNKIVIGNGKLTLKKDMTFEVVNDSPKFSNIKGTWDICCYDSDYGNYVFKVEGMPEWKSSSPEFYIRIDGKDIRLIFKKWGDR